MKSNSPSRAGRVVIQSDLGTADEFSTWFLPSDLITTVKWNEEEQMPVYNFTIFIFFFFWNDLGPWKCIVGPQFKFNSLSRITILRLDLS